MDINNTTHTNEWTPAPETAVPARPEITEAVSVAVPQEWTPQEPHQKVLDNLASLEKTDPDRYARVQSWHKATGYDAAYIDANLDYFEKMQKQPTETELDGLAADAPFTYDLLQNREDAPLIADEYDKMGFWERKFKKVVNGVKYTAAQQKLADLRGQQRDADSASSSYVSDYDDKIALAEMELEQIPRPEGGFWAKMPFATAELGSQLAFSLPKAAAGAAAGAVTLGGAGAAAGSVVPGAGNVVGAGGGALWGSRLGFTAGMAKYSYDLEGNLAYGDLRALRDKNGNPLPPEVAVKASQIVGRVNAALETAGDLVLVKGVLKPLGKLGGKAAARVAGKSLSAALGKVVGKIPGAQGLARMIENHPEAYENLTLRQTVKEAAKDWALTMLSENTTEYLQNVVQEGMEEAAKRQSGQDFALRRGKEVLADSLDGMLDVAAGTAGLGFLGVAGGLHRHMGRVREASEVARAYTDLGEGVKDLKLPARDPEKAVAFLANQTNGTPLEKVYIPIEALEREAEANGIEARELLQKIDSDAAAQYEEASATGGNVEIKTAAWAVKAQLIGKQTGKPLYEALAKDIKINPDKPSLAELQRDQEVMAAQAKDADALIEAGKAEQDELDGAIRMWSGVLAQAPVPEGFTPEEFDKQTQNAAELLGRISLVEAKKRKVDAAGLPAQMPLPQVRTQLSVPQKAAFERAQKVYAAIKDALAKNEEALAAKENGGKTPVLDFLIARGGVRTDGTAWAGEAANWRKKDSAITGLVNNKNGMGLEEAASAVQEYLRENGYKSLIGLDATDQYTPDAPDLIEAVNREITDYKPIYKRERYNKRLNELLNVSSGQFKTLYEKEFADKLPARGTSALKKLHYFLLREAVKDGMAPSDAVLAEHRINADALQRGVFDTAFSGANNPLLQVIGYPVNDNVAGRLDEIITPVKLDTEKVKEHITGGQLKKMVQERFGKSKENILFHNDETGWDVLFSLHSAKKAFNTLLRITENPDVALAAIMHIDRLFKQSVLIKTHPDRDGRYKNIHRFFTAAEIGGELYTAKMTVKELANGKSELDFDEVSATEEPAFSLYDLNLPKKIATDGLSAPKTRPTSVATNSITKNAANFKPTLRDVLRGVSDTSGAYNLAKDGRVLFQKDAWDARKPSIYFQTAYHGTPHRFDRFSLEHIGAGEGAQAHGWGLYFAADKNVAKSYRKDLSQFDRNNVLYGGKPFAQSILASLSKEYETYLFGLGKQVALDEAASEIANIEKSLADKGANPALEKYLREIREQQKILQAIDEAQISLANVGQVFEVDIPENHLLLDENKLFGQQPEEVRTALEKVFAELPPIQKKMFLAETDVKDFKKTTGKKIYSGLAYALYHTTEFNGAQAASELLNRHGIKGITYDGAQDGRGYVIFDDNAIKVLNKLYQNAGRRARGSYDPVKRIITLTPDANASTLMHELAHYWLQERFDYVLSGRADDAYLADFAPLKKYLEITDGQKELTDEQHEKFAKSFEAYLREGVAPAVELKSVFARFRRWMLRVYTDVKRQLGIELNDDIRRVFDRMVATEEEIAAAERERSFEPFTQTPGLTEEDVARLKKWQEDAHEAAVGQLLKEQMAELEHERQQKYLYLEEKITAEVTDELRGRDEYQIADVLESHFATKETVRNAKELAHAYHDNLLTADERALFDSLSELNGYKTGAEAAEVIVRSPDFDKAVRLAVTQRMEKYQLLKDMKNLREAAVRVLNNEKALEVLALERELFSKRKKSASVQRALARKEAAKRFARELLLRKPARLAQRYTPYFTAQKNAAKKAAQALARQDYEKAAQHKDEELLNAALAAESIRIKKRYERTLDYLKFIQRKPVKQLKREEHWLQIADLLRRLDMPRPDYDESMSVESLAEWRDAMKARGFDGVAIPDWILNKSRSLEYWRLNIDSLQDVANAIKNINHAANFENRLFTMHKRMTINELAQKISAHLQKTIPASARAKYKDQVEPDAAGVKKGMEDYLYSMTTVNTLLHKADGYHDFGLMYDTFLQPTKDAADKESVHLRRFYEAYGKLIDAHYSKAELKALFEEKRYYPELGNEATRERILVMALNYGNEINRKRLTDNPPVGYVFKRFPGGKDNMWGEASVESLLRGNLTTKDWDFVQGVWDLINEPWSAVSEMHRQLTGFTPGKVEPLPFAIATADGKTAQLRGGYFPIKYDVRGSRWAEQEAYLAQPLYTESNQAWFASTKQGHTKARAKEVHQPLALNLNLVERHMTEVLHDLYFRPAVIDLRRVLDNDAMRTALIGNLGRSGYNQLKSHLNMIATGGQELSGIGVINKTVEVIRRHTTIAVLAGKLSILVENFANPWLFAGAVEGFTAKDVLAGMGLAIADYGPGSLVGSEKAKAFREMVFEKSSMMKDKSENFDYSLRTLKQTNIFGENSRLLEFTNAAMVATDDFFAVPMWWTAYKKFKAELELAKDPAAEKKAVDRADMLINRVLGSGRKYDAAEILRSRNAIVRCMTMFATFMNNEFNRWSRETGLVLKEHDALRYAGFVAGRLLIWNTASMLLAGKWPDELDPEALLKWWLDGIVGNMSGMFIGLRDLVPVVVDKALGWQSFGYRPTPVAGTVEDVVIRPVESVRGWAKGKRDLQDVAETVARAASYLAPYPGQINNWFFNAFDYVINGMSPSVRDAYRRRPKKERN